MNVIRNGLVGDSAIRHVEVPGYPAPHSPYTHAVVANGFVFVSGQISVNAAGDSP